MERCWCLRHRLHPTGLPLNDMAMVLFYRTVDSPTSHIHQWIVIFVSSRTFYQTTPSFPFLRGISLTVRSIHTRQRNHVNTLAPLCTDEKMHSENVNGTFRARYRRRCWAPSRYRQAGPAPSPSEGHPGSQSPGSTSTRRAVAAGDSGPAGSASAGPVRGGPRSSWG